jgi:hypothetical protein
LKSAKSRKRRGRVKVVEVTTSSWDDYEALTYRPHAASIGSENLAADNVTYLVLSPPFRYHHVILQRIMTGASTRLPKINEGKRLSSLITTCM